MTSEEFSIFSALSALVISLIALGISLFEVMANRPRLRVVVSSAAAYAGQKGILHVDRPRMLKDHEVQPDASTFVTVEITNFGRQPTTIKGLSFLHKESAKSVNPIPVSPAEGTGATLPSEIAPGQMRTFFFQAMPTVQFPGEAQERPLKDFVFTSLPDLLVRHSWDRVPLRVKRLQR